MAIIITMLICIHVRLISNSSELIYQNRVLFEK